MNINDILTLARAGFTAEQIGLMYTDSVKEPAPAPAPAPANSTDELLRQLLGAVQQQNRLHGIQEAPASADAAFDACARIINPMYGKEENNAHRNDVR